MEYHEEFRWKSSHSWSTMRNSVDGTSAFVESHRSVVARAAPALLWLKWSIVVRVECHGDTGRQHCGSITECHECHLLTRLVLHSVPSLIMHSHGSRHILVLPLTVCLVCCCASFHHHVIHVRLTLTRH